MNKLKNILFLIIAWMLLFACNDGPGGDTPGVTGEQPTTEDTIQGNPIATDDSIPRDPNCTPNQNGRELDMILRPQEANFWCWAASGEMVMEELGGTVAQCDEANKRFGREDCCILSGSDDCDNGGWPQFAKYGYTAERTDDEALSWEEVKKQIDCRRVPFCVTWRIGDGGHMMVISGYRSINGVDQVLIRDPLPVDSGSSRWIRYSEYVSGPGYTHWDDFYNIQLTR